MHTRGLARKMWKAISQMKRRGQTHRIGTGWKVGNAIDNRTEWSPWGLYHFHQPESLRETGRTSPNLLLKKPQRGSGSFIGYMRISIKPTLGFLCHVSEWLQATPSHWDNWQRWEVSRLEDCWGALALRSGLVENTGMEYGGSKGQGHGTQGQSVSSEGLAHLFWVCLITFW